MKWGNIYYETFTHNRSNKDSISFQIYMNGKYHWKFKRSNLNEKKLHAKTDSKNDWKRINSFNSLTVGKMPARKFFKQTNLHNYICEYIIALIAEETR